MALNRPAITFYPNPFAEKLTIDISNPGKEQLTVDIYNLSGQKVKNLTMGNRAEKITVSWDGSNELGQQVPEGVYILKVNEVVKQVVKER
jgi:flagellar hook assembly protein FlgD